MKKNTQFLWFYTIILFSFALILILFAGLTQQNYEEEIETHKTATVGMQKSVTELTRVNTELREENARLKADYETALAEAEQVKGEKETLTAANEKLFAALKEYDKGNRKTARDLLSEVDSSLLDEGQKYIYDKIMK